ncbi:MAG: hypothetical protein ACHQQQ_13450 [Bacteroidota bacterium]
MGERLNPEASGLLNGLISKKRIRQKPGETGERLNLEASGLLNGLISEKVSDKNSERWVSGLIPKRRDCSTA